MSGSLTISPPSPGIYTGNFTLANVNILISECKHFECFNPNPAAGDTEEVLRPDEFSYAYSGMKYFPPRQAQSIPKDAPEFICTLRDANGQYNEVDPMLPIDQRMPTCRGSQKGSLYSDIFVGARDRCYEIEEEEALKDLPWQGWPLGRNFTKENCAEHCENLQNGQFITKLDSCWFYDCGSNRYQPLHHKKNRPFLEFVRDTDIKGICEPLGIRGRNLTTQIAEAGLSCDIQVDQWQAALDPSVVAQWGCLDVDDGFVMEQTKKCVGEPSEGSQPKGKGKAECADYCEAAYNGRLFAAYKSCYKRGPCDNTPINDQYFESVVKGVIDNVCRPLGIDGATRPLRNNCFVIQKPNLPNYRRITCEEAEQWIQEEEEWRNTLDGRKSTAAGSSSVKKGVVVLAMVFGIVLSGIM
ncbi:hypothetical protein BJ508DRAFT_364047 [Ascobolus immersus RN42]|uniref:Uncharacterized protein n=1 Tax=Ascobolus immersus RN42 TaxID=1160509 RepID=A0A3N4I8E8_ASCIM|nr:hypothetical protein BJ508DRAFT_364047 [Ascobolus immersus RN42]